MEVLLGVLIAILGLFGILASRLFTTFVHEAGHALSALLLTKGRVEMYVGSYGEEGESIKLVVGRLTLFLSFIIWDLDIGLCRSERQANILKSLIITLSGPLFSLIIGLVLLYAMTLGRFSDGQKFIISILMISSVWDFFVNLIPRSTKTLLADGSSVENDGRQLLNLYRKSSASIELHQAKDAFENGKKDEAYAILNREIAKNPKKRIYFETKLDYLMSDVKDIDFLTTFENYIDYHDPLLRHVDAWADVKIRMHEYDEVIQKLTNIIYQGKGNYELYFKRGKALVELGEYKDAMRDFHALTLGEVEDPLALANRAYCQYRLGYEEEACEDVLEAVDNGKSNMGEIYFFAGVIFEKSDEEKALEFYKKAVVLDYDHHALAYNISRIEKFK